MGEGPGAGKRLMVGTQLLAGLDNPGGIGRSVLREALLAVHLPGGQPEGRLLHLRSAAELHVQREEREQGGTKDRYIQDGYGPWGRRVAPPPPPPPPLEAVRKRGKKRRAPNFDSRNEEGGR